MFTTTTNYDTWIWDVSKNNRFRLSDIKEFTIKMRLKKDEDGFLIASMENGKEYIIAESTDRQTLKQICDEIIAFK